MSAVARFFDREQAYDGYSGAEVFKCQFSSYDDSAGDGSTNRRRGMSCAPTVVIPARRCIRLVNQRWIVSSPTDDSFQGVHVRQSFNLKRVTDLLNVLTPAQACLASAGTPTYVQKHYFKDIANALTDAEYDTFWNIFFALDEVVGKGTFLRDASGMLYRVRQVYSVAEGYIVAQTDQLDSDARQTGVVFQTGAYDQMLDTYGAGTVTTDVVQIDVSKAFEWRQQKEADQKPGDKLIMVPASALTPTPGMRFSMLARTWQVLAYRPELDGHLAHVRLA
jgi:hypothetical protein